MAQGADPFSQPNAGAAGEGDRASFQQFISATPLPGYVFDPNLALYVDPNMPARLRPHYVTVHKPASDGVPARTGVVPYTGKRPEAFLQMIQRPTQLKGGGSLPGYTATPTQDPTAITPESFLMGPTQRPNEPVTTGVPVGPGPSFVRFPGESDSQFRSRVGTDLLDSSVGIDPEIRSFATRLLEGG